MRQPRSGTHLFHRHNRQKCITHLKHLAGRDAFARHLGDKTFEVAYRLDTLADLLAGLRCTEKMLDNIETLVYSGRIFERKQKPAAQQTAAHRTHCTVDDSEQTTSVGIERLNQLEVAHCEAVETHIPFLLYARY